MTDSWADCNMPLMIYISQKNSSFLIFLISFSLLLFISHSLTSLIFLFPLIETCPWKFNLIIFNYAWMDFPYKDLTFIHWKINIRKNGLQSEQMRDTEREERSHHLELFEEWILIINYTVRVGTHRYCWRRFLSNTRIFEYVLGHKVLM